MVRGLKGSERTELDRALLSRPGDPPPPPAWWKGEREAAESNLAAAKMLRRNRKGR